MYALDSRYLDLTSCFSYRFSTAGTFAYDVSPLPVVVGAAGDDDDDDDINRIVVTDRKGVRQQQHHVTVSRKHGELVAHPAKLEVNRGDIVTWSTDGSVQLGFAVRGTIGTTTVDSAAMHDESVYTHAFGTPGEYRWADANGSGLGGAVRVVNPGDGDRTREAWRRALEKGTLVTVDGDRAEPAEVEILVGQTVVWAVRKAPGISITDVTLLPAGAGASAQ